MGLDFMIVKLEDRSILELNGTEIFQLGDSVELTYENFMDDTTHYTTCGTLVNIDKVESAITLELHGAYTIMYISCISEIKMLNQKVEVKDYIKDIVKLHRAKVLLHGVFYDNINNRDEITSDFLNTFSDLVNDISSQIISANEPGLVIGKTTGESGEEVVKYYCSRCYEEIPNSMCAYCPCCGRLVRDSEELARLKKLMEENDE